MKRGINQARCIKFAAAIALSLSLAGATFAEDGPAARGSLDAVKVLTPAATSQPAATMPAGHPGADEMASAIPGHPGKKEGPKSGALRILVSQGTKDGAAVEKDPVTVQLFSKGAVLKTIKTVVGEKGLVELHDLPLEPAFQPVISVSHGGVEQVMVGVPMHKYQPAVELEMKVYEVTAEKPAWTIGIRQISVEPVLTDGKLTLKVTEMMGGNNPLDRAWGGAESDGEKCTVAVQLPPDAINVVFGQGMLEAGAKVVNGKALRGGAMLPGVTEYVFGYSVPVVDGKVQLRFVAPTDTTLFAMYVPSDMKVDSVTGLDSAKAGGAMGDTGRTLLKAKGVKSGTIETVEISGIKPPPVVEPIKPLPEGTELNLPRTNKK